MFRYITILLFLTILCSGGFAQSPNSFSVVLDKKITDWISLPCEKSGFCIVAEKKTKESKQLIINHFDTTMHIVFDTAYTLPSEWKRQYAFYENGAVVVLYRVYQKKYYSNQGLLVLYHPDSKTIEKREVSGLPVVEVSGEWHHYQGNILSYSIGKNDKVWFLPKGATQPTAFPFTEENPGRVIATAVDTAQGKAIICFATGGRTAYFETDFTGKSSFANILNEPATNAHWVSVNHDHSLLILYFQDDETFYMHPVNILNHRVIPSETIYCADILVPQALPSGVINRQTVIISPNQYVSFLPTTTNRVNDRIYCITELYWPEYYNYFNGYYVEPRFNGYRYERADVHFFDTNGVFQTNVTVPFGEEGVLHSKIIYKLKISPLQNNDLLLYYREGQVLTTMLLDSTLKVKDPMRNADLPLPKITLKKQKLMVDRFMHWYGNKFLLTDFRINVLSRAKTGYDATRLEYR